jgi:Lrp/AsnC family transcriptional regulator, leucine-responsive regulatory protein
MAENLRLDRYDLELLDALQKDSRSTWLKLAEVASLSATAVQRRVQALQDKGVIKRFTIALDLTRVGQAVHAFVSVNVDRQKVELAEQFRRTINSYPQVQACYMLTGNVDFLLDVVAEDLQSYGRFIEEKILSLPGVKDASSTIVLDTVKEPQPMIPGAAGR